MTGKNNSRLERIIYRLVGINLPAIEKKCLNGEGEFCTDENKLPSDENIIPIAVNKFSTGGKKFSTGGNKFLNGENN